MAVMKKKGERKVPAMSTTSLPDVVYIILFFFMLSTSMRDQELIVSYKMPEATAAAIDSDGWLHSGDLARRTPDGYYKITGRIKDMIIRGGENIYPKEIEEFFYTHPKVKDVQVIGVPDKAYGEEIMACIVLKPGETATEEEMKQYALERLAKHKVPRYVAFVENFPMNAAGKILKYKMREWAVDYLNLQDASKIVTA